MSTNAIDTARKVTPATKYRVAIRHIALDQGFVFDQISASTDRFVKGRLVIEVHHGPSNLIRTAEIADANGHRVIDGDRKMFKVWDALTGEEHTRTLTSVLTDEQVTKFESGVGLAKIKTAVEFQGAELAPVERRPVKKAAPKPAAKKAPAPAASTSPTPRPKPVSKPNRAPAAKA